MVNKEEKSQTQSPQDIFIQSLVDEISQKTLNIAQLNATIADLNKRYKDLLDKYEGLPENHSKSKK